MNKSLLVLLLSVVISPYFLSAQIKISYSGDPLLPKSVDKIEQMFSYISDFYTRIGLDDTTDVELVIFRDRNEANKYMLQIFPDREKYKITYGPNSKATSGVYLPNLHKAVIMGIGVDELKVLPLIYHELCHHFTNLYFKNTSPPIWINEGLSEYFENIVLRPNGSVKFNISPYVIGKVKTAILLGELNLVDLLNMSQTDFYDKQKSEGQYQYPMAFVAFLVIHSNLPETEFAGLLSKISQRDTSENVSDIVDSIYPSGLKGLEKDLISFVNSK